MKKKILIVHTGGVVCVEKKHGMLREQEFTKENLLNNVPNISEYDIDIQTIFKIDSADISPEHWIRLAQMIKDKQDMYDGIVIMHGPYTMDYTASALSFLVLNPKVPIVFTGAQLPPYMLGSDFPENLWNAVRVAGDTNINEVVIVFNGKILRGNRCVRCSDTEYDGFISTVNPLGTVDSREIKIDKYMVRESEGDSEFFNRLEHKVGVIKIFPGMHPDIIRKFGKLGYKALVLEAFGLGNMPMDVDIVGAIRDLVDYGVVVVLNSQSFKGYVGYDDTDGWSVGSYSRFKAVQAGAIPCNDMTTEASITKLMWLLGLFDDIEEIKQIFLKSVAGEVSETEYLDANL